MTTDKTCPECGRGPAPATTLHDVLGEVQALRGEVLALKRTMNAAGASAKTSGASGAEDAIAPDSDLDGQYGDPTIRYDPRANYWDGESYAGRQYSETTPRYLDAMAKYLEACAWGARKDGDDKKARYKDLDAARARGWARRLASGWKPPTAKPMTKVNEVLGEDYGGDGDIPF